MHLDKVFSSFLTGTQWIFNTIALILAKGNGERLSKIPIVPPLDVMEPGTTAEDKLKIINKQEGVRMFITHTRFNELPPAVQQGKCKVVHVLRNPKDVCVSYFYFMKLLKLAVPFEGDFKEFFDYFISGFVYGGDWFNFALDWWKQKTNPHVLIIQYEDMKKHNLEEIKRLANFLAQDLTDEEVKKVAEHTTVKATKTAIHKRMLGTAPEEMRETLLSKDDLSSRFVRKGEIGDWKNHFTVAQNEAFDELYKRKMEGSGLRMEFE